MLNGDAYFYPAPVRCNDNKSDTFSNQSTPDHNDSSNDNFIVVKEAVLVLRMWSTS